MARRSHRRRAGPASGPASRRIVVLRASGAQRIEGEVRMVAPTVDPQTRNALVYVDLPARQRRRAPGMFARGEFELGAEAALTVPQAAVRAARRLQLRATGSSPTTG